MPENRATVAIVDDDPSVRRALCRLFGQLNMDAKSFSSGDDFIESFKRSAPDYLVLDMRMPRLNGWAVLSELRRMRAQIKTIIMSADDELVVDIPDAARAVVFLKKPVDEKALLAAIAQMSELQNTALRQ